MQAAWDKLCPEEQERLGPRVSVFGTVRRLREQRYCMVQTEIQY